MRKVLLAIALALSFMVFGMPSASATINYESCGSWFYGNGEVRACVAINVHDFLGSREALFYAWENNFPNDGGEFVVEFDWVVLKNANNLQTLASNTNEGVYIVEHTPAPGEPIEYVEESTDWVAYDCNMPDLFARARYQLSYWEGGQVEAVSGWIVRTSPVDWSC